eukprot:s662_g31.t1
MPEEDKQSEVRPIYALAQLMDLGGEQRESPGEEQMQDPELPKGEEKPDSFCSPPSKTHMKALRKPGALKGSKRCTEAYERVQADPEKSMLS